MKIKHFHVMAAHNQGDLETQHCSTDDMMADHMTKAMQRTKCKLMCCKIMNMSAAAKANGKNGMKNPTSILQEKGSTVLGNQKNMRAAARPGGQVSMPTFPPRRGLLRENGPEMKRKLCEVSSRNRTSNSRSMPTICARRRGLVLDVV